MKRYGLIGLVLLALLVTPAMAQPTNNVTLNESGLYLLDFKVEPVPPAVALKELNVNITKVYLKNTNLTDTLSGTVYLYLNGSVNTSYNCPVSLSNNTSDWRDCEILY
ncbi:MAG: hypothetical protein QXW74_06170, partial [Archaeoglobaceae archaeon]